MLTLTAMFVRCKSRNWGTKKTRFAVILQAEVKASSQRVGAEGTSVTEGTSAVEAKDEAAGAGQDTPMPNTKVGMVVSIPQHVTLSYSMCRKKCLGGCAVYSALMLTRSLTAGSLCFSGT